MIMNYIFASKKYIYMSKKYIYMALEQASVVKNFALHEI